VGPDELEQITQGIKSLCPAQKWDEYTPDVWLQVLRKASFKDAALALERLGARQPWIGASDIANEVRAIRRARAERFTPMPNDIEGVAFEDEYRVLREAVADGRMTQADVAAYNRWGGSLFLERQRHALAAVPVRGEIA
jgi:hypothetical protein